MIDIPNQIKKLLLQNSTRKNIRIHFPNGEYPDITNDNIIQNTVSFTESICSQDEIKLGLCEAATFTCEVVGVPNINNCQINVQIEIDCSSLGETWCKLHGARYAQDLGIYVYEIKYDNFVVTSCKKQTDATHRIIEAYTRGIRGFVDQNPFTKALYSKIYDDKESIYTFDLAKFAVTNLNITDYGPIKKNEITIERSEEYETTILEAKKDNNLNSRRIIVVAKYKEYRIEHEEEMNNIFRLYEENPADISSWCENTYNYLKESGYKITDYELSNKDDLIKIIKEGYLESYLRISAYEPRKMGTNAIRLIKIPFGEYKSIYPYRGVSYANTTNYRGGYIYVCTELYVKHQAYTTGNNGIITILADLETPIENLIVRNYSKVRVGIVNLIDELLNYKISIKREKKNEKYFNDEYFYLLPNNSINIEEALQGILEIAGMYGKNDRKGGYEIIKLPEFQAVYPSEKLYPSNYNLLPKGEDAYITPFNYISGWYDDEKTKEYGRISVEYERAIEGTTGVKDRIAKEEFGGKTEKVYAYYDLVEEFNNDEYLEYKIENNYFIDKFVLEDSTVHNILINVGSKIKPIRYIPCDVRTIGMPWIEAGDVINMETTDGKAVKTIVLSRTLSGEQTLFDSITAN